MGEEVEKLEDHRSRKLETALREESLAYGECLEREDGWRERAEAAEAQVEALRKVAEAVDQAAHGGADTIALLLELNRIGKMARAALTAAATPAEESSVEAEDGLDTPLPCDVQIAHIRYRKGVKLRTLVNAAARWHALASAACPLPAAPAEARSEQAEGEA